jgi:hypothetical protein
MKIRHRLAVLTSAVAITAAAGLAGAGAASASTTQFHWCDPSHAYCILTQGNGYGVAFNDIGSFTNFVSINLDKVGGKDYVEYKQVDTNNCLYFDYTGSLVGPVITEPCAAGNSAELFSFTGNVNTGANGYLVNLYASSAQGVYDCMYHDGTGAESVFVGDCSELPNDDPLIWSPDITGSS